MKILHINTWHQGGAANAARRLMDAQNKFSIDASFLSLADYSPKGKMYNTFENFLNNKHGKLATNFLRFSNKIFNQISTSFDSNLFFNRPQSLYRVHNHPLVIEADIIHLHSIVKFIDYPTFFKHINKPIIWTLHDMNPFCGGKHYDSMMFDKLNSLEKDFLKIKKDAIEKKNINVVSPSKWLLDLSQNSNLFARFPHYNIPYCINTELFVRHTKFEKAKEKKLLFVAEKVDDARKGINLLLDALPFLDKDIKILVLGSLPSENIFRKHSNVNSLGYVRSSEKLSKIYSDVDVYVISSIEDNLPNTVIESHICGTPVVGFNTAGIANMIDDGITGVLVDEFSGQSLAKGIEKAFAMVATERDLSKKIRKLSKEKYSERKIVDEYNEVYKNAILKR